MTYEDEVLEQFLDGEWDIEGEEDSDLDDLLGFSMRRRRGRRGRGRGRARRPRPRPRGGRRAIAPPASGAFKGQAGGVSLKKPTSARLLTLGFDSVADVAAAAQATINSQPQVVFRPDRLVIPLGVATNFLVNDLKIGKNSMFIAATPVPAECFSHDANGVGLKMDTAQVSQIIAISVTNLDAITPHRFTAALIGPSVE